MQQPLYNGLHMLCARVIGVWLLVPCRRGLAYLGDDVSDVFVVGAAHVHSPLMCLLVCLLQVKHSSTRAYESLRPVCADCAAQQLRSAHGVCSCCTPDSSPSCLNV
jgi:hypothetical protein